MSKVSLRARWARLRDHGSGRRQSRWLRDAGHLRELSDALPALVALIDREERYVFANRSQKRLQSPEAARAVEGRSIHDILSPDALSKVLPPLRRALAGERVYVEAEFANPEAPAPIHYATHYVPSRRGSEVVGVYTLTTDITRRVEAERERLALERTLQAVQRRESLSTLAAGIAHEFHDLLAVVRTHAAQARDALPAEVRARGELERIEEAAARAEDLCQQMLAYSGEARPSEDRVDLSQEVRAMEPLLRASAAAEVSLAFDFAPKLPPLPGDRAQIRQLLLNLVANAAEAIGSASGAITIRTGWADSAPGGKPSAPDRYQWLEVCDTGSGMDAETRARIFDPFFSTRLTGRGLGLAAVQGIVRAHGGHIDVRSREGHGTRIRAYFEAGAAPRPRAGNPLRDWRGAGCVLVVDDNDSVRELVARVLRRADLDVLSAEDGRAALEVYRKRSREIDLVVLDVVMPHMDGAETFEALRKLREDLPVVFFSGYSDRNVALRFAGNRPPRFLAKPFSAAQLLGEVRAALAA